MMWQKEYSRRCWLGHRGATAGVAWALSYDSLTVAHRAPNCLFRNNIMLAKRFTPSCLLIGCQLALGQPAMPRDITAGRTCEEKEAIAWGDNGRLKTGGECRHARKGRRTPLCMENMARGAMRIGISLCRQKIRCGVYTAHGSA